MTGADDPTSQDHPGDPVAQLEAFIAETEARGEPVPPEARAMLAHLRELMDALRELGESFGGRADSASTPETPTEGEERD